MTLSFKTKIDGKETYFANKILAGLILNNLISSSDYVEYLMRFQEKLGFSMLPAPPKIHTIRKDDKNRWKAGNKIHFVINNRTPDRFQFAPVVYVKLIQRISIIYLPEKICVLVDSKFYKCTLNDHGQPHKADEGLYQLALNDGFNSTDEFFEYFNTDFVGKIIHWTDQKY